VIQRIQTLYLLIVAGLFIALLFLPLAVLQSGGSLYMFDVAGVTTFAKPPELVFPTWSMMSVAAIVILLSFTIIFMYKRRILQIRMCIFNSLVIIGFCVLFGFYLWQFNKSLQLPDLRITLRLWTSFPIISLILNYLAIRNIGSDEALVRSLDRLRG
jgi:hypothetical protein